MSQGQCIHIRVQRKKTYITREHIFFIYVRVQNFTSHNTKNYEHISFIALYINEIKDAAKLETMTEECQTCCHTTNFFIDRMRTDSSKHVNLLALEFYI
jgi:hypothetical protein